MENALKVLGLAAVAGLAGYQLVFRWVAYAQSEISPYTYQYSTFWRNSLSPEKNKTEREIFARKSDGSTARLTTFQNSAAYVSRGINLANGDRIDVSDLLKMRTAFHATPMQVAARRARALKPASGCINQDPNPSAPRFSALGPVSVLGHPAFKVSVTTSSGIRNTQSFASDLDCAELDRLEETLDPATGNVISTFSRVPESLTVGEPDQSYFSVPAGYVEVPPSAMNIAWGKYFNAPPTQTMIDAWVKVADQKYYAAQTQ